MYELDVHKDFCVCRVMLEVRTADAIRTHMSSRRLAITFCSYILILQIQFVCAMECFILHICTMCIVLLSVLLNDSYEIKAKKLEKRKRNPRFYSNLTSQKIKTFTKQQVWSFFFKWII